MMRSRREVARLMRDAAVSVIMTHDERCNSGDKCGCKADAAALYEEADAFEKAANDYAAVFRAAADGIGQLVAKREEHTAWVASIASTGFCEQSYERYVRNTLSQRGDPVTLAMFCAYDGVATMFEKMAEAEKAL